MEIAAYIDTMAYVVCSSELLFFLKQSLKDVALQKEKLEWLAST